MTAKKRARRSVGRPRKDLTDRDIVQVEKLAGYGLTEAAIAHILDLGSRTFRDKKAADARILAALEKGRAVAEGKVGKAIYVRALKGDMTAAIWWEKTRANRSDRHVVDFREVSSLTDEQLAERRKALGLPA
jgi:hypothetical protein